MAISTKHRATIYEKFVPLLGEEDAEVLLDQLAASELDQPATKEFVRAEVGERKHVETALAVSRSETKAEIAELPTMVAKKTRELMVWVVAAIVGSIAVVSAIVGVAG